MRSMPFKPGANVPANASPEMKEFMQNRATLMQKMAELRQRNPSTNGAPDPKIFAQFQQENADLLKRQKELSQIIGQQQAKNPIPAPPPLQIPPNASPQLQAYLTARDQLMRDQIAFMNQHRTDDPATRQAAIRGTPLGFGGHQTGSLRIHQASDNEKVAEPDARKSRPASKTKNR